MTDRLKEVFAQADKLSPDAQDALAESMKTAIEEIAQWESSFADPRSEHFFEEMIKQGEQDVIQGKLQPAPLPRDHQ